MNRRKIAFQSILASRIFCRSNSSELGRSPLALAACAAWNTATCQSLSNTSLSGSVQSFTSMHEVGSLVSLLDAPDSLCDFSPSPGPSPCALERPCEPWSVPPSPGSSPSPWERPFWGGTDPFFSRLSAPESPDLGFSWAPCASPSPACFSALFPLFSALFPRCPCEESLDWPESPVIFSALRA